MSDLGPKTTIVQTSCGSLSGGKALLQSSANSRQQPIVVMVHSGAECCCCTFKVDIPSEYTVLGENWGKCEGLLTPGAKWCYPCNKRIACMVTKNLINYTAPIQRCPTKDNAYVDIVINFGFKLPQDETNVKNFIYKLGAGRFDELLSAEVEENVRDFIQQTWLNSVLDVKSDMAKAQTDKLNRKFREYNI